MNPGRRSKPGKVRPVVVIQSSDTLQAGSPGAVVVPCTSQIGETNILRTHLKPGPGFQLRQPSDILLDQIHTIDRSLFLKELGAVPAEVRKAVDKGIKFLLGF